VVGDGTSRLRVCGAQPKKDLSRFVRWPQYVRLQRQKKILFQRLKVPPVISVFRHPLDRAEGAFGCLAAQFPFSACPAHASGFLLFITSTPDVPLWSRAAVACYATSRHADV
jgi:hypothetical protein